MTFDPRRADAGAEFSYTDAETGEQISLKADGDGVVQPRTQAEVEILDGYDLPVAQKVVRERKAATKAETEAKAKASRPRAVRATDAPRRTADTTPATAPETTTTNEETTGDAGDQKEVE